MSRGFTLIEIAVVIAIIVIITGIVIFNIGSVRQNSALLRAAQNLSLNLRQVQNYSLSSKDFKAQGVPCGWGVHFNGLGSTSYIIFADSALSQDCSDKDSVRASDGSEDFEVVNFDAGIAISGLSNNLSDIVFYPPEPSIVFTSDQAVASITLINRDSSTRAITINKTGAISSP